MSSRPFAEATQAEIDNEVSRLLREAEKRAIELLKAHRAELDALVSLLLEMETVDGSDVYRLAGLPDRVVHRPAGAARPRWRRARPRPPTPVPAPLAAGGPRRPRYQFSPE